MICWASLQRKMRELWIVWASRALSSRRRRSPHYSQEANPVLERAIIATVSIFSIFFTLWTYSESDVFGAQRIGIVMTVNISGPIQRATTRTENSVDINKLRVLIAEHLEVDVRYVTDDAHLSRDLEADWLDRLELIILVEEIAGVEITDDEADQIEVVGDLIHYIDKRRD